MSRYDGNGNQTVMQKPSGARTTQVWDYENRLVKTIQPSLAVTTMAYDADGLRLKKEGPGKTTLFVWDDQNYLEETDAAGTPQTQYTTEPSTYGSLISHRAAGRTTNTWDHENKLILAVSPLLNRVTCVYNPAGTRVRKES